jgi:hypothetical protein
LADFSIDVRPDGLRQSIWSSYPSAVACAIIGQAGIYTGWEQLLVSSVM